MDTLCTLHSVSCLPVKVLNTDSMIVTPETTLRAIYDDMINVIARDEHTPLTRNSLFKGPWGALLYLFYYEQYIDDKANNAVDCLEKLYEAFKPEENTDFSFCNGNTGPFWVLQHLHRHDFLDIDAEDLLSDYIEAALAGNEILLSFDNFDFLHGSTGICNFLVAYAHLPHVRAHLEKYVAGLMKISRQTDKGLSLPVFNMLQTEDSQGIDAFSLAHGNSSVQLLLAKIHRAGIATDQCEHMISENIRFTINHRNILDPDSDGPLYPGLLDGNSPVSRLAWCYGDLNVAIALWHCGKQFGVNEWKQEALQIMHHSTRRDTYEKASIRDACICHGTAGIAAFYRRFWFETNDTAFYKCAEHWDQQTIHAISFPEEPGVNGIRMWQGKGKAWDYCWDLLDGSCGVGLSLISRTHNTAPLPWDELLMLS